MIQIKNISFSYGTENIFTDFSLNIESDISVVEGASGCGKTTLLKLISGLIVPNRGEITGIPQKPAFMFQEDRLLPWISVRENVSSVLSSNDADLVTEIIDKLEISEFIDKLPSELSGGQCRRVAIARALVYGGDMLILDEPLKGLDPNLTARVVEVIKSFRLPILVTSHSKFESELWNGAIIKL